MLGLLKEARKATTCDVTHRFELNKDAAGALVFCVLIVVMFTAVAFK